MRSSSSPSSPLTTLLIAGTIGGVLLAAGCRGESTRESAAPAASPSPATSAPPATSTTPAASAAPAGTPPSNADAPLPAAVRPFPAGLTGHLVFQSDREGRPKIYRIDLATGEVRRLTSNTNYRDENPRWSPDGSQIAFASNRAHYEGTSPEPGEPDFDLYVMNADGSNVRRVTTDPANERDPSWMPDGKSIVYSGDGGSRGDLYRVWLDGGKVDRLTRHFVGRAIMPTVSPDGQRIAFGGQTLHRGAFWLYQVHLFEMATAESAPLERGGGACWPAWAPDGRRLAYVLLDKEPSALEVLDRTTKQRQPLIADAKFWSYYPDWSPDGTRVAFSISPEHHDGENWDLAVIDITRPGQYVRLTTGPGNDRLPDWRPRS